MSAVPVSPSLPLPGWTDGVRRVATVRGASRVGFLTDNGYVFRYVVGERVRRARVFTLTAVDDWDGDEFLREMKRRAEAEARGEA